MPAGNDAYVIPESGTRELSPGDLEGLSVAQLRIARNEIYARHGRIFADQALRNYFSSKDWYSPLSETVTLSPIEQANVELIRTTEAERGG